MAYGFSGLNKNLNSRLSNSTNVLNISGLDSLILAVRVSSIVLDETHPRFKELGEWNALGVIEYQEITSPSINPKTLGIAYPLNPNNKIFPLINEIIYIISLPNTDIGRKNTANKKYYINNIGLWNHPHHNGYPITANALPPSQQKDYTQTQAGSVRRVTDNSTEINLGKTFKERANIHPLLPFEGDIIHEGRWGNSIRLGSTVKGVPNNWSSTGTDGDPLVIIRNGQGNQTNEGWIPIVENINNDDSSIYIASTQNIPLEASSTSYESYDKGKTPISPSKFAGKQILLTSGRLVFNSKTDHILLSSAKSINLNSLESINIDTSTMSVYAGKIYLGKNNATEPLMLGNKTNDFLKELISSLKGFMTAASTAMTSPCIPFTAVAIPGLQASAGNVLSVLNKLEISLNKKDLTSDTSYTTK
jgi:hypothetical protein